MTHMAVTPICSNVFYKDNALPTLKSIREERSITGECFAVQEACRCFLSFSGDTGRRWHERYNITNFCMKAKKMQGDNAFHMVHRRKLMLSQRIIKLSSLHNVYGIETEKVSTSKDASQRDMSCKVAHESEPSTNGRHLKALESYFSKLQNEAKYQNTSLSSSDFETTNSTEEHKLELSSKFPDKVTKSHGESDQLKAKKELGSLENYLSRLNKTVEPQNISSGLDDEPAESNPIRSTYYFNRKNELNEDRKLQNLTQLVTNDAKSSSKDSQGLQSYDETSDLYLICMLASINIAVFIFELASPIKTSDLELFSLPLLYGAKINELILVGEWWRLVTPMFLHTGFLHVFLGVWVLLTFGPQVCKGYGSFTFLLIYILGGVSGNLISFIHTPEPTVGGTGPVFAIIGSWLIYQIQNKDILAKEVLEGLFRKAVIATGLGFVLSNFGPIDEWMHFGAACIGIVYGFFTCPTLELDNESSKMSQEKGIAVVRQYVNPCKSLITFALFIVVLCSLVFLLEPPLNTLEIESLE
ncbi:PREDICTED: RHOMBOID-like protein 9, chloroplastic isoform X2 [Nelumbo nucifera]|uniref:RHOMBOID-like protein 9, chloroplastic isoform X2 n=1 Tax=Nelumbo nucifera TaxID=4432 RepID=A0A1U8AHH0_NELNU|nr:PREDICTED: RHOMBOID-like protein 9, chloroplastic isoform X2 [Nelumbo nucifera]